MTPAAILNNLDHTLSLFNRGGMTRESVGMHLARMIDDLKGCMSPDDQSDLARLAEKLGIEDLERKLAEAESRRDQLAEALGVQERSASVAIGTARKRADRYRAERDIAREWIDQHVDQVKLGAKWEDLATFYAAENEDLREENQKLRESLDRSHAETEGTRRMLKIDRDAAHKEITDLTRKLIAAQAENDTLRAELSGVFSQRRPKAGQNADEAVEMIGTEESLEGWPCSAGFAPRMENRRPDPRSFSEPVPFVILDPVRPDLRSFLNAPDDARIKVSIDVPPLRHRAAS